jgi:hypothetical protein
VDAAFTDARTQARRLCRSIWFLREVGGST